LTTLVIYVEFIIKPEGRNRFQELILANARQSLRDEPGCRRFDVLQSAEEPGRVLLYEIYDSVAAFDHHMSTLHYKSFAAEAESLIERRSVRRLRFVDEALNLEAERKTADHSAG